MRVEEMALRSEIRQMLNEAGFNKNTLKDEVKSVLREEIEKAVKQAVNETDFEGYIAMDGKMQEQMMIYSVAWIALILSMANNAKRISKNIEKASQILRSKEQVWKI